MIMWFRRNVDHSPGSSASEMLAVSELGSPHSARLLLTVRLSPTAPSTTMYHNDNVGYGHCLQQCITMIM